MKLETFFDRFDLFADAANAVAKMRELVLVLAVQGKLLPQDTKEEPAKATIARIPPQPRPARFDKRSNARIEGIAALSVGPTKREIPEGWSCVSLIQISRLESGHTPSRKRPDWWGGDVSWVGLVDARLHDGKTILETLQHTNSEGLANSAARMLPAGTVCVSRTASVGYVTVLGKPMATSQDFVNWVPTQAVTPDWLRLVFTSEKAAFRRFSKGAVHQTIYYPEWLSMHTLLPPLAEQRRIVAKVDELMAFCDRLEAQQQERETRHSALARASLARFAETPTSANLDFLFHKSYAISPADLRKSILTLAVQGKLVLQDPNDEPAAAALGRIREQRERLIAVKQFRRSQLPELKTESTFDIPSSWEWSQLGNAMLNVTDGFHSTPKATDSGIRYITAKHVKPGLIDFETFLYVSEEDFREIASKTRPKKGDVLVVNIGAGCGLPSIIEVRFEFAFKNVAILNRPEEVDSKFLFNYLFFKRDEIFEERTKGGAQPFLSLGLLRGIPFPLPPLAEQRRIVAKVEQLMVLVDQLEAQLADSQVTARNLLEAVVAELAA